MSKTATSLSLRFNYTSMAEPIGGERLKDLKEFYLSALGVRYENVRATQLDKPQKVRFFVTRVDNFLLHLFVPPIRHDDFIKTLKMRTQEDFSTLLKGTAYPPSGKEGAEIPDTMVLQFISQPIGKEEPPVDMPALRDAVLKKFQTLIRPGGEPVAWTTENF